MYRISSEIPASSSPVRRKSWFRRLSGTFSQFSLYQFNNLHSVFTLFTFLRTFPFEWVIIFAVLIPKLKAGNSLDLELPKYFTLDSVRVGNVNRKVREWYFVTFTQSCNILFAPFWRHQKPFCCVNIERPGNKIQFQALISRKIAKVTFASATKSVERHDTTPTSS